MRNKQKQSTHGFSDAIQRWFRQHGDAASKALGYYKRSPITSLLTLIAITVSLAVPASLYLGASGFTELFDLDEPRQINAFMQLDVSGQRLNQIAEQFRRRPDVESVDVISREQSLKDFRESSGMDQALDLLKENPLPGVLVIHPGNELTDITAIRVLADEIQASRAVKEISIDADWLGKLFALGNSFRKLIWLSGLALATIVILLIHFSLRAEIIKRKEEIQVVKLVGGSPSYVQRPFIYFAVFFGLAGALLALIVVKLVAVLLVPAIQDLSSLYGKTFSLSLTAEFSFTLISLAILLSTTAAWLTIRSILREIEPG